MNYPSPRTPGSTPLRDWEYSRMTPAPTPSRPMWFDTSTPRRPATRAAHTRSSSYSQHAVLTPRTHMESPRYNSYGDYCTVDVSATDFSSSRRHTAPYQAPPRRHRHSYTYVRASTPYGESDEDEIIEILGEGTYVLPGEPRAWSRRAPNLSKHHGGWYTNEGVRPQSSYHVDPAYARASPYTSPQPQPPQARPPTSHGHSRRSSASVPQRSSTVRPAASGQRSKPPPSTPKATEADARRHRIPQGYSLKNWDPEEQPILLLGSVFDANSLGKWIYDWTVYHEGPDKPIADMAGDLWLLLIKLYGKIKRAEEIVGQVRSVESREILNDFIDAGERLTDKLRALLKACESPMLKAAKKKGSGLGKNSGVEFVVTLFGRDRELAKTEKLMQGIRLFNLRFDANCQDIIDTPTL
ncbi:uncharacterized protein MAM_00602 [Metarhizium album ARSEF 1941]|uniref:Vegetative cell wall protein gp1 n=1 Tax=Metarhizium album (strain ARSEF 1941) TaxID=1081103 RepID=A0A0B2X8G3_METAS|nr:uncharacterized protein MAM_00602 [Metarhizium album ARSEF 1941]KHO01601.1 hypothetical protein MAM_00602 [Metarhizium album ARSEF 1941]